jgi:hypothetical protein
MLRFLSQVPTSPTAAANEAVAEEEYEIPAMAPVRFAPEAEFVPLEDQMRELSVGDSFSRVTTSTNAITSLST